MLVFPFKAANFQGLLTMFKRISGRVLGAALSLVCVTGHTQLATQTSPQQPAAADPGVPELRLRAGKAYENKDYEVYRQSMSKLHELRPNNSEYMYHLVLAHALLDEKPQAFNLMLLMQRQGLSYDFNQSEASMNLRKPQLYSYLNDLMIDAGKPLGTAIPVVTLAPDVILPEGIEWDASRDAFLVSAVRSGSIIAVSKDGTSTELLKADESNRVWGIYDIAIDAKRDRLWAVSTANEDYSGFDTTDRGRSVLIEIDLSSMEIIKRYPVPIDGLPHNLRNVTVSPKGDIYAVDGVFPIVYVKLASERVLRPMAAYKNLVSLRGLDISDDGKLLYLADYEMGILVINLESGKSASLAVPDTLNLGGIAGLYYWNDQLVVIQNGIKPQRILNLQLDASGRAVSNVAPLAVNLESMDYPSYGTVVGNDLFFFANSHWASNMESAKPVAIARTVLSDAPVIIAPDARKFMKEYASKKGGGARKISIPDADVPKESGSGEEKKEKDGTSGNS